jgi:HAD superfamily hydrolase (TIGR01509 family)
MVEAVLFDCDGVLVDSEILAVEVETQMLAEIGLRYDIQDFKARFMGMSDAAFFAALDSDSRAQLDQPLPKNFEAMCRHRLYREVGARLKEVEGAAKAVTALNHAKAVASSSMTEKLRIKLERTRLWHLFDPHVYGADHVTHAKPAPDLFLFAAKALGVPPESCLVIEDSVNGVRAALAAGMRVWGFTGGGHMDEPARERLIAAGVERIVPSWEQAAVLFSTL